MTNQPCPHENLRLKEITDFTDACEGQFRYLCTECGAEIVVPWLISSEDATTDPGEMECDKPLIVETK